MLSSLSSPPSGFASADSSRGVDARARRSQHGGEDGAHSRAPGRKRTGSWVHKGLAKRRLQYITTLAPARFPWSPVSTALEDKESSMVEIYRSKLTQECPAVSPKEGVQCIHQKGGSPGQAFPRSCSCFG